MGAAPLGLEQITFLYFPLNKTHIHNKHTGWMLSFPQSLNCDDDHWTSYSAIYEGPFY